MKQFIIFAAFKEPTQDSVIYWGSGYIICAQKLTSPRHAFFKTFFSRKEPFFSKVYSVDNYWGYYSCNEEEVKLLKLAKKLPEDSKLWYELRRKLLQGCDLQDLIQTLEVYVLAENLSL